MKHKDMIMYGRAYLKEKLTNRSVGESASQSREVVIVENIHLVCLPDFGVKTNAKLTPIFKL